MASSARVPANDRYGTLVQSIDEGFCVVEVVFDAAGAAVDYRFLEANRAFARHTGLIDAVGRSARELAPELEEFWFTTYGNVARTGEPIRFIHEARTMEERWFDVYAFRVDAPELNHVAILFTDITGRVRAEHSAAFLSMISQDLVQIGRLEDFAAVIAPKIRSQLQLSQCAFLHIDRSRRMVRVVSGWIDTGVAAISGEYHFGEFGLEAFWEGAMAGDMLVVPDVAEDKRVRDAAWFHTYGVQSFLAVPMLLHGELRQVMLLCRRYKSRWPGDVIEMARELAARCWVRMESVRAAMELRASEERLQLVLENAREYAIFAADLDRRVTSWNPGAERLLGFAEAEILGRSADIIFTKEDRQRGVPLAEAECALREGRAANERWHRRKDGSRFWGSGVVMSMRDRAGRVVGMLKIMRDQTAEAQTRLALEQSQRELMAALQTTEQARAEAVAAGRAKDQFLAALSHELRTPLNPVLMIASEAADNPELDAAVRADFDMIRKNIELEARLIDDILDISRITQGKLALRRSDLSLHDVLQEAVASASTVAAEKEIGIRTSFSATNDRVNGDSARLQQIFLNLLNNAVKFTPGGGHVRVVTENTPAGDAISIHVVDTGIGMTPAELERIFQPFAQGSHADATGSAAYGGLGLGLAIVEELTSRHGGTIDASSPGPGQGSTFTVRLPLAAAPAASDRGSAPKGPVAQPGRHWSILLVEDHGHTRVAMERVLRARKHSVVSAGTLAEAEACAAERRFDLLIADIGLPDGDGYVLLGRLREKQPHLAGIALSGFGMQADLRRSRGAGFAAHLVKPVPASKLEQEIARVLAGHAG